MQLATSGVVCSPSPQPNPLALTFSCSLWHTGRRTGQREMNRKTNIQTERAQTAFAKLTLSPPVLHALSTSTPRGRVWEAGLRTAFGGWAHWLIFRPAESHACTTGVILTYCFWSSSLLSSAPLFPFHFNLSSFAFSFRSTIVLSFCSPRSLCNHRYQINSDPYSIRRCKTDTGTTGTTSSSSSVIWKGNRVIPVVFFVAYCSVVLDTLSCGFFFISDYGWRNSRTLLPFPSRALSCFSPC